MLVVFIVVNGTLFCHESVPKGLVFVLKKVVDIFRKQKKNVNTK